MSKNRDIQKAYDELAGPTRFSHLLLWISCLFIVVFITWAAFAKIDEVTHSEGKVIPSQRIQVIQNLEGGIIKEILVDEGQIVNEGQILVYLDDTRYSSEFQENHTKELALRAKLERLEAQVTDTPYIPSQEVVSALPDLIRSELALFKSKQHEMSMLNNNLKLLQQEIDMTRPMIETGAVSVVEVLRLEQQLSDTNGRISSAKSAALDELNRTKGEMAALQKSSVAMQDRLTRTTIRSPVKGIVKQLYMNTVGGVIRPGMDLMEIVPLDDTLLVEAKVKPKDVGFIHTNQKATIKISAFDFSIYGGLEGQIEHISADTSIDPDDQKKEAFYEIWVRTQQNHLGSDEKPLRIIPGMTATVDILTGEKTVLDYLLKPIMKARQRALRER